ncbi:MAG: LPS assembly lipoprotein LptE [Legionellaceae bacterium]|nr:LPS assembly lipoprotein LptE [Legionellaceae bacterium]
MKVIKSGLLLTLILLTSCGYHLEGYITMPKWFNNVALINQDMDHDLRPLLVERLKAYDICVCKNIAKADYWLVLEEDKVTERITSVSSSTTPRQYQMTYAVRYRVRSTKGKDIIPPSNAIVTRQFTINSNRILGSDFEGDLLKKEMYRDAVTQILDHIQNLKK